MRRYFQVPKVFLKVRNSFKRKVVILMYHRVNIFPNYPYPIVVSPENFYQHMDHICTTCQPLHLIDLVSNDGKNKFPKRGVVVTFDDGYVDVYTKAFPVLKKLQIPATVFVTLGNLDHQREFWWDELDRIILVPINLPSTLCISIRGKKYEWKMNNIEQRKVIRKEIHALLRPLSVDERKTIISEIVAWANLPENGRQDHLTMTSKELVSIQEGGFVDLGAHTINHPLLSSLSYADQYAEIVNSKQMLEKITGSAIETFAYPFGSYDENTLEIVKSTGFRVACTTNHGIVKPEFDPFCVPRFWVGDWDLNTFKHNLDQFFNN